MSIKPGEGHSLTWDANGQLTDDGTARDFVWTGLGQLAEAQVSGEVDREYSYDAFGRRVSTTVGSQTNEFIYHGWHMIGEYDDSAGDWLWQEIPMPSGERMLEHIALDTNDLDSDTNTTEYRPYAVHEDFQSTVWSLSEADGDLLERYDYPDPYGASSSKDSSGNAMGNFASDVFHRKRLHGGFVEKVSALYDFRNRWLDPESGSWLSRDPLGQFDSENLYQAFRSSPLLRIDPFGNASEQSEPVGQECFKNTNSSGPSLATGESCPAARLQRGYCEGIAMQRDRDPELGGLVMLGLLDLGVCKTGVVCACNLTCPSTPDSVILGATTSDGNTILIYYYSYKRHPEDKDSFDKSKCCPCANSSDEDVLHTLVHEGLHSVCLKLKASDPVKYANAECGHEDDEGNETIPDSDYDNAVRDLDACRNGNDRKSSACNRARDFFRKMRDFHK